MDRRSAELAKYTANALLATRISFMNEISHIAMAVEADVDDVAQIVGMDPRIGPAFLKAGLGWGGSCFPKDVLALSSLAASNGCRTPILQAVYDVNERQREHAVELLLEAVRAIERPVVAILGLAFKPNTDDVRGSPALSIAQRLLESGVAVRAHDPFAVANADRMLPAVDYRSDPYSALDGADALLVATEWEEYRALDWVLIRETMRGKTVLDGRNALDEVFLGELGFRYWSLGATIRRNGNGHARKSTIKVETPPVLTGTVYVPMPRGMVCSPCKRKRRSFKGRRDRLSPRYFGSGRVDGDQNCFAQSTPRDGAATRVDVRGKFLFAVGRSFISAARPMGRSVRTPMGRCSQSARPSQRISEEWWMRTSTPFALIPFLQPGCSTSQFRSDCMFSLASRGSSTSPFWTRGRHAKGS